MINQLILGPGWLALVVIISSRVVNNSFTRRRARLRHGRHHVLHGSGGLPHRVQPGEHREHRHAGQGGAGEERGHLREVK